MARKNTSGPVLCQHCKELCLPTVEVETQTGWGYLIATRCPFCHGAIQMCGVSEEVYDSLVSKYRGKAAWNTQTNWFPEFLPRTH